MSLNHEKCNADKKAREHIQYFATNDRKLVLKIFELFDDMVRNPFAGIGKPEPLKEDLKGLWSRRITDEHRMVYEVTNDSLIILSCKSHY